MIEFESSAKSVDKAIANALKTLNVNREDVDIRIIDAGGFFRNAKVILEIPEELADTNPHVKSLAKINNVQEEAVNVPVKNKEAESVQRVVKTAPVKEVNIVEKVKEFLDGFFKTLNLSYSFEAKESEKELFINLKGEKLADVVGYHGEGLKALQYLLAVHVSKFVRGGKRIILDINGFKEKRKVTVEDMARRIAARVIETGTTTHLQPMNAYERLVFHNIIKEYSELESHSEGVEPKRHLVVSKKQ